MSKNVFVETVVDMFNSIISFFKDNLLTFANLLNTFLPYVMYFIGQAVALHRGETSAGGELFIPIVFLIIIYFLKSMANKLGKGVTVPIPEKRFTTEDDGEVSIDHERLQELILYVADLEDWLERKGLM